MWLDLPLREFRIIERWQRSGTFSRAFRTCRNPNNGSTRRDVRQVRLGIVCTKLPKTIVFPFLSIQIRVQLGFILSFTTSPTSSAFPSIQLLLSSQLLFSLNFMHGNAARSPSSFALPISPLLLRGFLRFWTFNALVFYAYERWTIRYILLCWRQDEIYFVDAREYCTARGAL